MFCSQIHKFLIRTIYLSEEEFHTNELVTVSAEPIAEIIGVAVLKTVGKSAFDPASRRLAFVVKFNAELNE